MDYRLEQIRSDAWRITCENVVRMIHFRNGIRTFAPWDVTNVYGQRLWAAFTLESACRWVRQQAGISEVKSAVGVPNGRPQ
jgi:hypothetical protein